MAEEHDYLVLEVGYYGEKSNQDLNELMLQCAISNCS